MEINLKRQFLALLIVLSLGGLTGLEPVLHNHALDQDTHEDCLSCGCTQISLDQSDPLPDTFNFSCKIFTPQDLGDRIAASVPTAFLSRAPPTFS